MEVIHRIMRFHDSGGTCFGFNRFKKKDRLNIDQYTMGFLENQPGLTEDFWPMYALAAGIGTILGWSWLLLLGSYANGLIKVSVHVFTTYLAVMSVLCFWSKQFFRGVSFATGAALQFLYVVSVVDIFPFIMIVLKGAIKMVRNLPEVMGVSYEFMMVLLLWLALWSYGVAVIVTLMIFLSFFVINQWKIGASCAECIIVLRLIASVLYQGYLKIHAA